MKAAEQSLLTALNMQALWTKAGGPADTFIVLTTSDPVPVTQVMMQDARILRGVTAHMVLMHEETSGPVAPVLVFDTKFGLAAYLWTQHLGQAFRITEALEYGIVGLNDPVPSTAQAPFGGVKQSGYGRGGSPWGIQEYLTTNYLSMTVR